MTSKRASKDWATVRLTALDMMALELGSEEFVIRSHGEAKRITAGEAVLRKSLETALKGSPHAQRQMLECIRRAETKHQFMLDEEITYWRDYRAKAWRAISAAKQSGNAEPVFFPHPDDIDIDTRAGVTINGPVNEAEMKACEVTSRSVLAWLYQDALERRLDAKGHCDGFKAGDPYSIALLVNEGLPRRLKRSGDDIIAIRMQLARRPKRELLKETKAAWKSAGQAFSRGGRVLPPERMRQLLEGLAQLSRQRQACADDPRRVNSVVEEVMDIILPQTGRQ